MQMSFFDFEEFNELKAEAKKKETPKKNKEEKQKKKTAQKENPLCFIDCDNCVDLYICV